MNRLLIFSKKTFLALAIIFGLLTAITMCILFINNENAIAKKTNNAKIVNASPIVTLKVSPDLASKGVMISGTAYFQGSKRVIDACDEYKESHWGNADLYFIKVDQSNSGHITFNAIFSNTGEVEQTVEVSPTINVPMIIFKWKDSKNNYVSSVPTAVDSSSTFTLVGEAVEAGSVKGSLMDQYTGLPIQNATCSVYNSSQVVAEEFTVPNTGVFEYTFQDLSKFPDGKAYLVFSAPGYQDTDPLEVSVNEINDIGTKHVIPDFSGAGVVMTGGEHHQIFSIVGGVYEDGVLLPDWDITKDVPTFEQPMMEEIPPIVPFTINELGQLVIYQSINSNNATPSNVDRVVDIKFTPVPDDPSYFIDKWTMNGEDLTPGESYNLEMTKANVMTVSYATYPPAPVPEVLTVDDFDGSYLPETLDTLPLAELSLIFALITLACLTGFAFSKERD